MKRKFLLVVCAVLCLLQAKAAYTISDLESTGWTLVTSTEGLTSTNYYLFVDAETSAYAMARTTNSRPVYVKLADPFSATHQVWKLEANNSKFYIQSNVDDYYFYSGNAGYNDEMSSSNKTAFTFTYAESKWKINDERSGTEIYVGAWQGVNWLPSKWYQSEESKEEYQRVVSNKAIDNSGHFLLYSIPRTTFESNKRTLTTLTNAGWESVTAAAGLAQSDRYYLFLDSAFPCMAMTNMGGERPKFKALGDPTSDNTSLWTIEENFSGYAIKNVDRDEYLWTNVTWIWECNFRDKEGELAEGNAYQYAFTLNDGKWKLHSAALAAQNFQGRWANSDDYPYETEDIASNKTSTGIIQWAIYSIPKYLNDIEGAASVTAGTYFLRTSEGKYMSRGSSYQTRTTADAWGLPITIVKEDKGLRLKYADTNNYLYAPSGDNLYTDNDGTSDYSYWAFVSTDGGYKLVCTESTVRSKYVVLSDGCFALATSGDPVVFTLEAAASHPAQMAALKNSQAAAVATAVGLEGITTVDALSTAVSDWNTENIPLTQAQGIGERYEGSRAWSDNIASETKTLSAGLYRLTVYGFHKMRDNATTYTLHNSGADSYPTALVAGDQSVQLCSVFDVASDTQWDGSNDYKGANNKYYPANQTGAGKAYDAGNYLNTLYFYVDEDDTDVLVGIKDYGYCGNATWTSYRGLTLTRIAMPYEALSAILDTRKAERDAKTWGFENGEYAPYSSAAMLADIETAEAMVEANDLTLAQSTINALTTRLTSTDTWGTANVGDVECVYNGDFSLGSWGLGGWSRPESWGKNLPSDEPGITVDILKAAGATTGSAYYNQTGSLVYGNTGYYTMPLKANSIYTLTFKYASFDDKYPNGAMSASVLNSSSQGMAAVAYEANTKTCTTSGAFEQKTIKFVTTTADNYVLTLASTGNTTITDVSITKDAEQTLTFKQDGTTPAFAAGTYPTVALDREFNTSNYSTLCLPFAMDATATEAAFEEVYELTGVEGSSIKFAAATTMTAGKPYLVLANSTTLTVDDVELNPATIASNTPVKSGDNKTTVTFVGTFDATTAPTGSYVVSNNNLYLVNSTVNVAPYRGYFTVETEGSTKNFVLDFGDADAISDVRGKMEDGRSEIFNLAGQKMSKLQRGVNIVNGKKVLVR